MNKIKTYKKTIGKKILKILCVIAFILGIIFDLIILLGGLTYYLGILALFINMFVGFFILIFLASTVFFIKLINKENKKQCYAVAITGLAITSVMALPLMLTPVTVSQADAEFKDAFGRNWQDKIPDEIRKSFLSTPFTFTQYFLGTPEPEYEVKTNIKYYEDEEIELCFDVYKPKSNPKNLPGKGSIIVYIHGGGWASGDKEPEYDRKYLSAQGYIVFDIQYGLVDSKRVRDTFFMLNTPKSVIGKDITIQDQVWQIGFFTKRLVAEYAEKYGANLDSVYIMGGSAGGYLASIIGFGLNENTGKYAEFYNGTFSTNLKIKGIIPLYPANDIEFMRNNENYKKFLNSTDSKVIEAYIPSNLIDKNDPPALIFQGTSDGITPPSESAVIESSMDKNGAACCRLIFPLAPHGGDLYFHGYYGQVWLYYLERFLYLTQ